MSYKLRKNLLKPVFFGVSLTFITGGVFENSYLQASSIGGMSVDDMIDRLRTVDPDAIGEGRGVKMTMRVQDSTVNLPQENVFLARSDITTGPSDAQFIYADKSRAVTLVPGKPATYNYHDGRLSRADSVDVYANLRVTSDLFQGDLQDLLRSFPGDKKLKQATRNYLTNSYAMPVYYFLKGEEMENAYYTREEGPDGKERRMMVLGYYKTKSGGYEYTAMQPDIIWHEMGHGILDASRPDLLGSSTAAGALHEAYGDINAMFTLLSRSGVPERLIYDVNGDLHYRPNFLSSLAEQFGKTVLSSDSGLRNADDDITDQQAGNEVHDKSRVLSGIVYDVMASAYKDHIRVSGVRPYVSLEETSTFLRRHWVYSVMQVSETPQFVEIGGIFRDALPENNKAIGFGLPWQSYVSQEFEKRGIDLNDHSDPWGWYTVSGVICHDHGKHDKSHVMKRITALEEGK